MSGEYEYRVVDKRGNRVQESPTEADLALALAKWNSPMWNGEPHPWGPFPAQRRQRVEWEPIEDTP